MAFERWMEILRIIILLMSGVAIPYVIFIVGNRLTNVSKLEEKLRDDRIEIYNKILEPFLLIFTPEEAIVKSMKYKKEKESDHPVVWFVATLMNINVFELDKLVELANKYGVKEVISQPLTACQELGTEVFALRTLSEQQREEVKNVVWRAKRLAKEKGIELRILNEDPFNEPPANWNCNIKKNEKSCKSNIPFKILRKRAKNKLFRMCHDPWKSMFINESGGVNTCCYRLGEIAETVKDYSVSEIWHDSKDLNKIRNSLLKGDLDSMCAACSVRPKSEGPPIIPNKWTGKL